MQIRNLLLLLFICCFACKNAKQDDNAEKFDKIKWVAKKNNEFPYRDKMLKDLIDNHKLHGLKKEEVINMLGQPSRSDNGHLFYKIDQELIGNIFPLHTKTLVIKLNKDSTVEWRKIHE
ncbi:MAG: hypothetical protein JWR72_668 [Flavisolibacter sp.]|jgi:hypothetical protein|nr:hypothetical protein [Flavisolibacter sp.]